MMSLRLLFLLLLLPVCVMAAEKPNLVLNLKAEKEVAVTGKDGKTRFEWRESSVLDPGNVVRYTLFYTNSGSSEARNAVIVDPVPAGTTYVAGSAEGKGSEISFSMDGKQFSPPTMLKYRVKPVPPGGNGSVSFSVKVK